MPNVFLTKDTLNELNPNFVQQDLKQPVFLNSVPKSGTHLLRNIIRMFVPVSQQYDKTFIQIPNLKQHLEAFRPSAPKLSWGHLLFSDESALATREARQILLVRDPYKWVLARARFFMSESFEANIEILKSGHLKVEEVLNLMIFGIPRKAPTLEEIYRHNAASWLGTGVKLVHYEALIEAIKNLESIAAAQFFKEILEYAGIDLPEDWQERVRVGSDRKQSGTARENLAGAALDLPDELPDVQKQLVDFAAPGLRALLGYT